jgi:hypothetical protein
MNPQDVMKLQTVLLARGLYRGKIDGQMGPQTQQAMQGLGPGEIEQILSPPPPQSQQAPPARVPLTEGEIALKTKELEAQQSKDSSSSLATKMAIELAPLLGGAAIGHGIGEYKSGKYFKQMDKVDELAKVLRQDAKEVMKSGGSRMSNPKAHIAAGFGDAAKELKNVHARGKWGVIAGASPWLVEGAYARHRSGIEEDPHAKEVWDKASQFGIAAGLGQAGTEMWARSAAAPVNPSAIAMAEGLGNAGKAHLAKETPVATSKIARALGGAAGKLGAAGLGFGAGMFAGVPIAKAAGMSDDTASVAGVGAGALGAGAIAAPAVRKLASALLGPAAAALSAHDAYQLVKYMIEQEQANPTPDTTKYQQMNVSP